MVAMVIMVATVMVVLVVMLVMGRGSRQIVALCGCKVEKKFEFNFFDNCEREKEEKQNRQWLQVFRVSSLEF